MGRRGKESGRSDGRRKERTGEEEGGEDWGGVRESKWGRGRRGVEKSIKWKEEQ